MKPFTAAITALLSSLLAGSVLAGEVSSPSIHCSLLGRVLTSYDSGIHAFSKLCAGGSVIVGEGLKIKISCYQTAQNKWLHGGTYSINRLCSENRRAHSSCWWLLCTRSTSKLLIQSPNTAVIEATPNLKWSVVPSAQYYNVDVFHLGQRIFNTKTSETSLNLVEYGSFETGQVYSLEIRAINDSGLVDKASVALQLLSDDERLEIEQQITLINTSSLKREDRIQLIDSVYRSAGLTLEAIEFLESEARYSRTLLIAKLLADHYSEISDPVNAKINYEIVAQQSPIDSDDYEFANEMLNRILEFQVSSSSSP